MNERMSMMEQAIRVVESFLHRGDRGLMDAGDAPTAQKDLNTDETSCYRAALRFITKEFGRGWREGAEVVPDPKGNPDDPTDKEPVRRTP
jgi:hypothetical protein